jgi:hypothetical protein
VHEDLFFARDANVVNSCLHTNDDFAVYGRDRLNYSVALELDLVALERLNLDWTPLTERSNRIQIKRIKTTLCFKNTLFNLKTGKL